MLATSRSRGSRCHGWPSGPTCGLRRSSSTGAWVRIHLAPTLGKLAVQDITEELVRRWRKNLLDAGVGAVTVAKAYRLLKAILNTAVDDGMIRRNPCRLKGAGQEDSPERPVLTLRQVFALADAADPCYRALILLAVFCGLRWGELAALRRRHIDLGGGVMRVEASVAELTPNAAVRTTNGHEDTSASESTGPAERGSYP